MRTTIDLDADAVAAVAALRRERRLGLSEAVNELIRHGLAVRSARPDYQPRTTQLGLLIDVANIADALEVLEGSESR